MVCVGLGLDYVIHIDEAPAQAGLRPAGRRGLARAMKPGEDDAAGRGCGLGLSGHPTFSQLINLCFSFEYRESASESRLSAENHHYGSGCDEQAAEKDRCSELFAQQQPGKDQHYGGADSRGQVRVNVRQAHLGQQGGGGGKCSGEKLPSNSGHGNMVLGLSAAGGPLHSN